MCYLLAFPTRVGVKVDIYLLQQSIFSLLLQRIFTCHSMSRAMEESSSNAVVFRWILIFRDSLFLESAKPSFYASPYWFASFFQPFHSRSQRGKVLTLCRVYLYPIFADSRRFTDGWNTTRNNYDICWKMDCKTTL